MNHREAMRLAELAYFSKLLEETRTIAEARQVSGLSKAGIYKALNRLGLCRKNDVAAPPQDSAPLCAATVWPFRRPMRNGV